MHPSHFQAIAAISSLNRIVQPPCPTSYPVPGVAWSPGSWRCLSLMESSWSLVIARVHAVSGYITPPLWCGSWCLQRCLCYWPCAFFVLTTKLLSVCCAFSVISLILLDKPWRSSRAEEGSGAAMVALFAETCPLPVPSAGSVPHPDCESVSRTPLTLLGLSWE